MLPTLSNEEIARYSRHLILEEVGMDGQRRLKGAKVLCVGTGGLGSPLLLYLAAAGVGTIGIVDFDVVDASNLQRQIIHGTSTIGQPKVQSAAARIRDLNPNVQLDIYEEPLSADNALRIFEPYDVIVDGTDNFPTRYLVNDACVILGKPNVYGSIFKFEGQATVFNYQGGPNYRDLYPEPPPPGLVPSCAEGGVLGILPGIIGTIQATETVKILLGTGTTLSGRLLLYDALHMRFRELKLRPGMTASVTFIVEDRRDALLVPNTALRFTPSDPQIAALAPAPAGGEGRGRGRRKAFDDGPEAAPGDAKTEGTNEAKPGDAKADTKADAIPGDTKAEARPGDAKADTKAESTPGDAKAETTSGDTKSGDTKSGDTKGEGRRGGGGGRGGWGAPSSSRNVWILVDGKPKPAAIKIGISDGSSTEVTEGELSEGALIIVGQSGGEAPKAAGPSGSPLTGGAGGGQRGGGGGGGRKGGF